HKRNSYQCRRNPWEQNGDPGNNMTQTKKVTLNPGESQKVAFSYTPKEAKTYYVTIDGLSGSFKAIAAVEAIFQLGNVSLPSRIEFYDAVVFDKTASRYYWYSTGGFPVHIPIGHEVYGAIYVYNRRSYRVELAFYTKLTDPDGIVRAESEHYFYPVSPDHCEWGFTDYVVVDKSGNWTLSAIVKVR
ncbi:unnamed protein product, partial [marine sediment metagenome]